jgi:hypothetical protein
MQARTVHSQYYPDTQHTVYTHITTQTGNTLYTQSITQTGNTLYTHSTLKRYSVHSSQPLRCTDSDASGFPSSNLYTLHTPNASYVSCTPHFSSICRLLLSSASCLNVLVCLQIAQLSTERCGGFRILSHKEFFPIPFYSWRLFFDESRSHHVMDEIKDSFGVHLWNKLSKNTTVNAGSQQPYSLIAARACPRMYAVCGGCL